ncbi:UNVERIFIED_CONTAM: hypothetical protein PYX00_000556 [Menopon gallinae]|uniref:Uncharacterized protein n=1 Tax=Menopon gallinae TaxID=328185 RepID=A0AAW2IAJ1_9NEOP
MARRRDPCSYELPCRDATVTTEKKIRRKYNPNESLVVDALPRDITYSFMPPAYYAKGYRIIPTYKKQFDYTEMRKLLFLEDSELAGKWKKLRARLPYPETRVVDLPGTRDLHYKNYCLRSLNPISAMSWRKSIVSPYSITREELYSGCEENKRFL